MKTTRKRYRAEFKAKVALEAIRSELTLTELAAKRGVHHTMIASWKRQAMMGWQTSSSGADKAAGESEVEKLHAKIGQLAVERDFLRKPSVDERGSKASDGRACSPPPVDLSAMPPAADLPFFVLLRAGACNRRDAGADVRISMDGRGR